MTSSPGSIPRQIVRRWGPIVLSLILLAGVVAYIYSERAQFTALNLSLARPWLLPIMFVHFVLIRLLIGSALWLYVAVFDIRLKIIEGVGLAFAPSAANLFMPGTAGMLARLGYLKARYNLSVARFLSMQAAMFIVVLFGRSVLITTLMLMNRAAFRDAFLPILIFFVVVGVVCLGVILLRTERSFESENRVLRWINHMLEGWRILSHRYDLVLIQLGIVVLTQLNQGLQLLMALWALNIKASYWQTMMVTALAGTLSLVQITPGNLGITEAVSGLSASLIAMSSVSIVTSTLLLRGMSLLSVLLLGAPFSYILSRQLADQI